MNKNIVQKPITEKHCKKPMVNLIGINAVYLSHAKIHCEKEIAKKQPRMDFTNIQRVR